MTIVSNLNPGSDEAIQAGCTCPVLDNGHGKGSGQVDKNGDPLFWINSDCPVHTKEHN